MLLTPTPRPTKWQAEEHDSMNAHPGEIGQPASPAPMIDPFGRMVSYLRVSVTDRCDFRCTYCMAEKMVFLPKKDLLTLEELERLCSAFIGKGVRKIRLTGGEPLVRHNIMHLVRALGSRIGAGGLEELTLTTNGSQLARYATELADAGIRRINVSVDTLDPEKFHAITRLGDLGKVLEGIDAAQKAGIAVKINAVALKDFNDADMPAMIRWAHAGGMDMTIIETMPMGEIDEDRTDRYLPLSVLRRTLEGQFSFEDIPFRTGGPARYVKIAETGGRLGFITPMTHNFCESCNRVRLTCTGTLYMCLGQEDAADLRAVLRQSDDDTVLAAAIDEAIRRKPKGHDFIIDRTHNRPAVSRHMSVTGG
jgi:cyclic pyranopterin phosphate synthase